MKTSLRRGLPLLFVYFTSSALALAHPGHDDHELTWDFSHLVAHPLVTLGWFALLIGLAGVAWYLFRHASSSRFGRTKDAPGG